MEEQEEFSTEELVHLNEDKIDALINLLIKKGIITEKELSEAVDALYNENESEEWFDFYFFWKVLKIKHKLQ